jgi:hypothetical protein
VSDIDVWWPLLHEQIRRVLVNGIWLPVSRFARDEIERLGPNLVVRIGVCATVSDTCRNLPFSGSSRRPTSRTFSNGSHLMRVRRTSSVAGHDAKTDHLVVGGTSDRGDRVIPGRYTHAFDRCSTG